MDLMPYLPTVNAMAPNAPTGAAFIKMATSLKMGRVSCSKNVRDRFARFSNGSKSDAKQDGHEEHLKDVAFDERAEHGGGYDVEQESRESYFHGLC